MNFEISTLFMGIISGVISAIISTVMINNYYHHRMPKLKISSCIAKNSQNFYKIKIINQSRSYATNVYFELQLVTSYIGNGGTILKTRNIELSYDSLKYIAPYSKTDSDAKYAIRLTVKEDLLRMLNDNAHSLLRFVVYCSNENNTASRLYEQCYYPQGEHIRNGEFAFGDSLSIN